MRALQGIGGALVFGTSTAILVSAYPPAERGKVLGINTAAIYLGLSVGPFLGGILTEHAGWRSVFLANLPPTLVALLIAHFWLRDDRNGSVIRKFDLKGSLIYGTGLAALMYGFTIISSWKGLLTCAMGIMLLWYFMACERRAAAPVLDLGLFTANRVFAFSNLAALLNYSATFAVSFLLSLFLQYVKGFGPEAAGFILVSQPAFQTVFSPLAGRLSDRVEPRIIASAGMGLCAVGLAALVFLNESHGVFFLLPFLVILGIGFAFFSSPNVNAIMGSVEQHQYGVASGVLATMRITGQLLSMGVTMLIFSVFLGQQPVSTANMAH